MTDWSGLSAAQRETLNKIGSLLGEQEGALSADASMNSHPRWDSYAQLEIMMYLGESKEIAFSEENVIKYSNISEILSLF